MTVEQAVRERLVGDSAVAALVGARVYQLKLPQKPTLPAVRVQLIDEPLFYHLRGGSRLIRSRVQTDCYVNGEPSTAYAAVTALADAVDAALSACVFKAGGSPAEISVEGVFRQSRGPGYEADELRLARVMQDYIVWWRKLV